MTPVTDPAILDQLNGGGGLKPVTDPAVLAQLNGTQEAPAQPTTSQGLGFYQGLMKPLDNAAMALEAGAKALGIPTDTLQHAIGLPTAQEAAQGHQSYVQSKQAAGVQPGAVGRFGGEVLGTAPSLLLSTNPIAAGAMGGALLTDKNTPMGVATDAALGAAAGKAGDLAVKGAGRLIAPVVDPIVKKLVGEGVELTPGQILGGIPKRIEDAATSIPVVGDFIKGAQNRSLESFNKAAVNRAIAPIGERLPADMKAGYDAVNYAGDKLSAAYDNLLPQLSVKADPQFAQEVTNLRNLAQNLPKERADQVSKIIDDTVAKFSPQGSMSGETMKDIESELSRLGRRYSASPVGDERMVGDAVTELRQQLRDVTTRSNPAQAPQLQAINQGYANLLRVEAAAKNAKDGIFTPGQLQTGTRVMDSSLRKRASARGNALMQDLATAARQRLPSSVPDSGTPTRLLTNILAGGGAAYLEPSALIGAGVTSGLYTKPAQDALRFLLARDPSAIAQQIAQYLSQLKGPAAVAGPALLSTQ